MRISKLFSVCLVAALFAAGTALAGSMAARFGNTVVVTYPDGAIIKFFYNQDSTFSATAEAGGKTVAQTTGKWRQDGDKLCVKADTDFGAFKGGEERCVPLQGDKVGDTWQTKINDS